MSDKPLQMGEKYNYSPATTNDLHKHTTGHQHVKQRLPSETQQTHTSASPNSSDSSMTAKKYTADINAMI